MYCRYDSGSTMISQIFIIDKKKNLINVQYLEDSVLMADEERKLDLFLRNGGKHMTRNFKHKF